MPKSAEAVSPFLFVTGVHRSGTTLVRDLITQHPAVSTLRNTGVIEDEGQHLQTLFSGSGRAGRPGKFAYRKQARLTEIDARNQENVGDQLCEDWSPYWAGGGELFVEKSPINTIRTRFLSAAFPRSRFVVVLRHPVAVSYATQKWTTRPKLTMSQLLRHWVRANMLAAMDATQLADRVMFLHYEAVTRSPEESIRTIFEFAGLDSRDISASTVRSSGNDAYLARWRARRDVRHFLGRAKYLHISRQCARFGYQIF